MATYDVNSATTTDMSSVVKDVTISARVPDATGSSKQEVNWDYPDSNKYLGYYKEIPELKSALHVLAQRVAGLGWDSSQKEVLDRIIGSGEDTFSSICQMLIIEKKVFGDAFAEIIRNDRGTLINIKKVYAGDMRIVLDPGGLIVRY